MFQFGGGANYRFFRSATLAQSSRFYQGVASSPYSCLRVPVLPFAYRVCASYTYCVVLLSVAIVSFPSSPLMNGAIFLPLNLVRGPIHFRRSVSSLATSVCASRTRKGPSFFMFQRVYRYSLFPSVFRLLLGCLFQGFFGRRGGFISSVARCRIVYPRVLGGHSSGNAGHHVSDCVTVTIVSLFGVIRISRDCDPRLVRKFRLFLGVSPISNADRQVFVWFPIRSTSLVSRESTSVDSRGSLVHRFGSRFRSGEYPICGRVFNSCLVGIVVSRLGFHRFIFANGGFNEGAILASSTFVPRYGTFVFYFVETVI